MFRVGEVGHSIADITRARKILGYEPRVSLEEGLADLVFWLKKQIARERALGAERKGMKPDNLTV